MPRNVFAIEVEGEFIDLPDNASFRYELINPHFISEVLQGDFSFPYVLPPTDFNCRKFGFASFPETHNRKLDYTGVLYLFGVPKFKIKVQVTRAVNKFIHIVVTAGVATLPNIKKKLSEVDLGEDYILGFKADDIYATAKQAAESGDWTEFGFTFVPFHAPNFYNGLNANFLGVCNRVDSTTGDILANSTVTVNNKYNLVPWLFLHYVLDRIFKECGLTPTGKFWTDPELSKILLFNNFALEQRPENFDTRAKTVSTTNLVADGDRIPFVVGPQGTFDNPLAWDPTAMEYIVKEAGRFNFSIIIDYEVSTSAMVSPIILKGGSLDFYIDGALIASKEFPLVNTLKSPSEKVGQINDGIDVTFTAGDLGKAVWVEYKKSPGAFQNQTFVIVFVNSEFKALFRPLLGVTPATPPSAIQFKNHVPDITVGELLSELKKLGVTFDFTTGGVVELDTIENKLRSTEIIDVSREAAPNYDLTLESANTGLTFKYDFAEELKADIVFDTTKLIGEYWNFRDIPPAVEEGQFAIVSATNELYESKKADGETTASWRKIGYYYQPHQYGNGGEEVTLKLLPILMAFATNEGGSSDENEALMPYYTGSGSSPLFGLGNNPFPLMMCFWRGYNEAGHDSVARGGKYILASSDMYGINKNKVGNFSMRLDKNEAILRTLSERFYQALTRGEIIEKDIDLDAITFGKVRNTSLIQVDYNLFWLKSVSIFANKQFAKFKAYLLKL